LTNVAATQGLDSLLKFAPSKSHQCDELYSSYAREVLYCLFAKKADAVNCIEGIYTINEEKLARLSGETFWAGMCCSVLNAATV
jgi:hypothetical protein